MKINKIIVENLNSLKGRFEIALDEAPFKDNSLFAITGPTGSGKSTLLDAIGLALFNEVPRFGKITDSEITAGNLVNHFCDQAMAEVHYTAKGKNYISRWSIRKKRTLKWDTYNLEVFDANGTKLTQKKTEAVVFNKETIGLDFNQFRQSLLLSQGAFQKFLLSKVDERSTLLEQITGTYIYREISKQAYAKNKELNKELEALKLRLEEHRNITPEEITQLNDTISEINLQKSNLQASLEKEQSYYKLVEEKNRLKAELQNWVNKEKQLILQKNDIEKLANELKIHELLYPLYTPFQDLKNKQNNHKQQKLALAQLEKQITDNSNALADYNQQLLKKYQATDDLKGHINKWISDCKALENKKSNLMSEGVSLKNNIIKYSPLPPALAPFIENKKLNAETLSFIDQHIKKELVDLKLIQVEECRNTKINLNEELDNWQKYVVQFNQYSSLKHQLKEEENTLTELGEKKESLQKNITPLKENILTLETELTQLNKATKNADFADIISQLRTQLENGSPCEVCGATEHPFSDRKDPLNWAIKMAEKEQKEKDYKTQVNQLNIQEAELKAVSELISANSQKAKLLQDKITQASTLLKKLNHNQIIELSEVEKEMEVVKNKIKSVDHQLQRSNEMVHWQKIQADLKLLLDKSAAMKTLLDQEKEIKYQDDYQSIAQKELQQLTSLAAEGTTLDKNKKQLLLDEEILKKDIADSKQKLINALKELGYDELEVIDLKTFKGDDLAQKLRTYENYKQNKINISEQISELNQKLSSAQIADIPEDIDLQKLNLKLQDFRTQLDLINKNLGTKETELKNTLDQQAKRKALQKAIDQLASSNEKWFILNKLIGSLDGKKFNKMAQQLSLRQLLIRANFRLQKFNDRYSFDIDSLDGDFLSIIDHYMADTQRSIRSLSGGETFLLSLCMALSLADMASGGNKIESLFIDEGFGTLDDNALESALGLLEKVQQEEGKTVGIISHVASIKERIPTQIQLVKNNQGSSQLKIVS